MSGEASVIPPAAATGMLHDLEIVAGPLQGGSALVRDYLAGASALEPFYTGHPGDIGAYVRKAAEVDARLTASDRSAVASALLPLGDAAPALERVLAGDGYFVTTGQQPALFGGPLYTLYKVLGAIRTAAALERELGKPVLALFWIGSDDHDWAEANQAGVLDRERYARRVTVAASSDAPALSLAERSWGAGIGGALDELAEVLPGGEFHGAIMDHVRTAYTADHTVAASFAATMTLLLQGRRVVLLDSAHPALRRAALPVLQREVRRSTEHFAALRRQTERLEAAGYAAQVPLAAGASNVMQHGSYGRERLVHDDAGWRPRAGGVAEPAEVLLERMAARPDAYSANVLLRPVVESAVLPTIAYVAGPGELSYFAQLGCLFLAHGVLPPVVVARPSVTLVDGKVRKVLDAHGLDLAAVRRPLDALLAEVVSREVPPEATAALERVRTMLHTLYDDVMDATDEVDPTLRGPLTAARNWSIVRAREAEKRILRHMKRRNQVLVDKLRKVSASLYPDGAPQERGLNALPFIARYGLELVPAVEAALPEPLDAVAQWHGPACG